MKKYIVKESEYPVATEIHEPSYYLVNQDNPTERYMCAPDEFALGEELNGSEFWLERRDYMHEDSSFNAVFATKFPTKNK